MGDRATSDPEIWRKAGAFGMAGEEVDGMDVLAVRAAAQRAVERARAAEWPEKRSTAWMFWPFEPPPSGPLNGPELVKGPPCWSASPTASEAIHWLTLMNCVPKRKNSSGPNAIH